MARSLSTLLSTQKKELLDIYRCALESVNPWRIVEKSVSIREDKLIVEEPSGTRTTLDLKRKGLHVIGAGKSTLSMACGLANIAVQSNANHLFSHGCLSVPVDQSSRYRDDKLDELLNQIEISCLFGSKNNLPDNASVEASRQILSEISRACESDRASNKSPLFILLISGGGSSCLTSPRFIELDEKLSLIKYLAQKGCDIVELNSVRRCFSNVKGGQLAMHIHRHHPQAEILTLILSDVVGDPIEFIASGPTYLPTKEDLLQSSNQLRHILDRYEHPDCDKLIGLIANEYEEVAKDIVAVSKELIIHNAVIGNNSVALDAATSEAVSYGYSVINLGNKIHGQTQEVVDQFLGQVDRTIDKEKTLIIGAGEATVNKKLGESWGLGGRVQEMALDYLIAKMSDRRASQACDLFIAATTDGQDGPTDVAACMVSGAELREHDIELFNYDDVISAKRSHDSHNFWKVHKPEWLVRLGSTGTNVMDLYMLAVSRSSG